MNLKKIQLSIIIIIVLIGLLAVFSKSNVTGFVSADSKSQQLNLLVDKSTEFILTSGNENPYSLVSFRVSGQVIGKGAAEIYLSDITGKRILVYRDTMEKSTAMSAITGMATGKKTQPELDKLLLIIPNREVDEKPAEAENQEIRTGFFTNECMDSCFMNLKMSINNRYKLIVLLEPETSIKISRIEYAIKN
ncbi:hypothetical protein KY317_02220 [Candidatus Woesearchaeota archaeon]|nr:hypothetical protein [Candidatus Woesearchaeota archaeon]